MGKDSIISSCYSSKNKREMDNFQRHAGGTYHGFFDRIKANNVSRGIDIK
jgi:hypothetical protein